MLSVCPFFSSDLEHSRQPYIETRGYPREEQGAPWSVECDVPRDVPCAGPRSLTDLGFDQAPLAAGAWVGILGGIVRVGFSHRESTSPDPPLKP